MCLFHEGFHGATLALVAKATGCSPETDRKALLLKMTAPQLTEDGRSSWYPSSVHTY